MSALLTDEQIASFERDGFIAVPDFMDSQTRASIRERAIDLVDNWEPSGENTVFTTEEQERVSNHEFLSSGGRIWCFFEEEAFDERGELRQAKELSINKIGHAQHDLDDVFERATYTSDLAQIAADIGMADALALQSMYIFKQPGIGGEVSCHQDGTFLYTDPLTVTGFWLRSKMPPLTTVASGPPPAATSLPCGKSSAAWDLTMKAPSLKISMRHRFQTRQKTSYRWRSPQEQW